MNIFGSLSRKQSSAIAGLIIILVYYLFGMKPPIKNTVNLIPQSAPTVTASPPGPATYAKVVKVVDGDTITIDNKVKVRYIGVNTPELHDPRRPVECFGQEAYLANKNLVEGKTVRLEKDVSDRDKYGRLLRFVYLEGNASGSAEIFVNDYLVKNGFARVSTFPPDVKFADQFRLSETEARNAGRGLWSGCQSEAK